MVYACTYEVAYTTQGEFSVNTTSKHLGPFCAVSLLWTSMRHVLRKIANGLKGTPATCEHIGHGAAVVH